MTMRFCTSCMADVGLDPLQSRLALPGCSSPRMAFCDGAKHDCTIMVDEHGSVIRKNSDPVPNVDKMLEKIRVPEGSLVG